MFIIYFFFLIIKYMLVVKIPAVQQNVLRAHLRPKESPHPATGHQSGAGAVGAHFFHAMETSHRWTYFTCPLATCSPPPFNNILGHE